MKVLSGNLEGKSAFSVNKILGLNMVKLAVSLSNLASLVLLLLSIIFNKVNTASLLDGGSIIVELSVKFLTVSVLLLNEFLKIIV